jgi:D-arabinose 1-dehydrogenase-like Zn-dependent alcohol dehydrogenase
MVMMARWARARVIAVDIAADKFDACREAGADEVVDASRGNVVQALLDLTHGQGIDVAVDFVSATSTLEAGVQALGRGGRLVALGGSGESFQASARTMLRNEQDLLGSRYVTRLEVMESLELVARGEIWPMFTDIRTLKEAEELHEKVEKGLVIGRAALRID